MANYRIAPVKGPPSSGSVRKYSPNDEDRGGNSRYQPDRRERKDGRENKSQADSFTDLFESRIQTRNRQETAPATAFTTYRVSQTPVIYSYKRAKIVAATLAWEMKVMQMAE